MELSEMCGTGSPRPPVSYFRLAGYKAHTRARSTGTLVYLCDAEEQGISAEDGGKYLLICEPHAGSLNVPILEQARGLMRHPEEWCPSCQGEPFDPHATEGRL